MVAEGELSVDALDDDLIAEQGVPEARAPGLGLPAEYRVAKGRSFHDRSGPERYVRPDDRVRQRHVVLDVDRLANLRSLGGLRHAAVPLLEHHAVGVEE